MVRLISLFLLVCSLCLGQRVDLTKQIKGSLPVLNGGLARTTLCPTGEGLKVVGGVWDCAAYAAAVHTHAASDITSGTFGRSTLPAEIAYEDEANVFTLVQTINPGTTPAPAISIPIAQPPSTNQRDSHSLDISGSSFDSSGHTTDWRQFADITSDAGASTYLWQSRIDAGSFTTRGSLSDAGVFKGIFQSPTSPAAGLGLLRLANTETIAWRNAGNTLNVVLSVGVNDTFVFSGPLENASVVFASLGTPNNGTQVYCSDCTKTTPCADSGTGAMAFRVAGAWECNP